MCKLWFRFRFWGRVRVRGRVRDRDRGRLNLFVEPIELEVFQARQSRLAKRGVQRRHSQCSEWKLV